MACNNNNTKHIYGIDTDSYCEMDFKLTRMLRKYISRVSRMPFLNSVQNSNLVNRRCLVTTEEFRRVCQFAFNDRRSACCLSVLIGEMFRNLLAATWVCNLRTEVPTYWLWNAHAKHLSALTRCECVCVLLPTSCSISTVYFPLSKHRPSMPDCKETHAFCTCCTCT